MWKGTIRDTSAYENEKKKKFVEKFDKANIQSYKHTYTKLPELMGHCQPVKTGSH